MRLIISDDTVNVDVMLACCI